MEPQQDGVQSQAPNQTPIHTKEEGFSKVRAWTSESMGQAFVAALRGERVREIDRYQVYSDYRENETVVFIHDPTGRRDHKYIFASREDGSHTYIVAAPTEWTKMHREILQYVRQAAGPGISPRGGGYVTQQDGGALVVDRSSGDFGSGDHDRARKAFEEAVRSTAQRNTPL